MFQKTEELNMLYISFEDKKKIIEEIFGLTKEEKHRDLELDKIFVMFVYINNIKQHDMFDGYVSTDILIKEEN